jgi:acetyl-CoA C-acetyltransferase
MSKVVQKLDKKRSEIYENAPIAEFGKRKPDFSTMGRKIKNPHKKFREVVCVEACRTPYGRSGGALKDFSAMELGALAIKEVLRRTEGKVNPADVDYIFMGQVVDKFRGARQLFWRECRNPCHLLQLIRFALPASRRSIWLFR